MTISSELEAKILRYYHVEKWRAGTIARQLSIHPDAVKRTLAQAGIPKPELFYRESIIDPYLHFIVDTLSQFPDLTASRLYAMVSERGYPGSESHFRHLISIYRPKKAAEAYLRLKTLPGEQAQVDWGHFGSITLGKAKRPLMAFVMVLSYSRKIFLRFYVNQQMANFLRGHVAAFDAFGGVPKVLLYDNLKSAVLERQGDAIRFHPTLLELSAHYHFEPRPVAVYRGNEKGRVERAIRYIRDNFFPARSWRDLDDLNKQAELWCNTTAANRPCPENRELSVKKTFESEKGNLIGLPDNPFVTDEIVEVHVGKTPYVRFDLNDYSIPSKHVRSVLTVKGTPTEVMILSANTIIATHERSYDKHKQIEDDDHIQELASQKKHARSDRGKHRLTIAVPSGEALLNQAAERGYHLASIVSNLLQLLDDYGANELDAAIKEALSRGVAHPNAVRISLEASRERQQKPAPVPLQLPADKRVREMVVTPHELTKYDKLQEDDNGC